MNNWKHWVAGSIVTMAALLLPNMAEAADNGIVTYEETPEGIIITGAVDEEWYLSPNDVILPDFIDGKPVIEIGEGAFSLSWPKQMTGRWETIEMPSHVHTIRVDAFSGARLGNFDWPDSLESIEDYAFAGSFEELDELILPDSLVAIGDYNFGYAGISKLTLPSNLESIGDDAFMGNELTEITFPDSLTEIGDDSFYDNSLTTINWPEGNFNIGEYAFSDNHLTSISLPQSVGTVGESAFSENRITSFDLGPLTKIPDGLFSNNDVSTSEEEVVIVIEEGVTELGYNAFGYWYGVVSGLSLPSTLRTIDRQAFFEIQLVSPEKELNLQDVNVGSDAFGYSEIQIDKITIDGTDVQLDNRVFAYSKILTNEINISVDSIDEGLFDSAEITGRPIVQVEAGQMGGYIFNYTEGELHSLNVSSKEAMINDYGSVSGNSMFANSDFDVTDDVIVDVYFADNGYGLKWLVGGDISFRLQKNGSTIITSSTIQAGGNITVETESHLVEPEYSPTFYYGTTFNSGGAILIDSPLSKHAFYDASLIAEGNITFNRESVGPEFAFNTRIEADKIIFGDKVVSLGKIGEDSGSLFSNSPAILPPIQIGENIRVVGDHAFDTPLAQTTFDLNYATQIGRHVFGDNDTMERLIIRAGDAVINSHAYFPARYGRNGTATEDPSDFIVMGCYGTMVEEFADIRGYSFETIADCKTYYVDGYNPPEDDFRPGTPVITHTGTNPSPVPVDVTVTYASEDTLNQFRVNYGKWTTYTGTFTIYGDVFIQARSIANDGWVSNYGQLDLNWMEVPGSHPGYPLTPPGEQPPVGEEPTPYPENPGVFPPDPDNPGDGGTDPEEPTDPTDPEGPACTFEDISRYVYVAELMKRDPHVSNAIQKVAEMDDTCADKQALEDRMAVVVEWIAERDYQLFKDIVHRNLKWAQSFEREPYLTALDASEDLREEDQPEIDEAKQAIYDAMTAKQVAAAVANADTQVKYAERYKRDPYLTRAAEYIDKVPYGTERDALQARLDAVLDAVSATLEAGKLTAATAAVEKAEAGSSIFLIDEAQALVTALKDSDEKTALQGRLDAIELTDAMLFAYELKNDIAAIEVESDRQLFDTSFDATKAYAERVSSTNLAKAEAAFAALAQYGLSHADLYERLGQYLADVKAKIAEDAMYARAEATIALAERYKRQTYIDKAQAELDLLPEGERRDTLQDRLDAIVL